jgi:hypothetical protein
MRALLLSLILLSGSAIAQESRVASYYLNNPEKWEGRKITINCSHVARQNHVTRSDGKVTFWAYTASRSDWKTASIDVVVDPEEAPKFAKKYGFGYEYDRNYNYRTRPLSGIFARSSDGYCVEYTPSN